MFTLYMYILRVRLCTALPHATLFIRVFLLSSRRSSARAIEELQRTLIEVETRYKTEITRIKKKYETDIRELEGALDNANKANAEYLKQIRSLQQRVKVCSGSILL